MIVGTRPLLVGTRQLVVGTGRWSSGLQVGRRHRMAGRLLSVAVRQCFQLLPSQLLSSHPMDSTLAVLTRDSPAALGSLWPHLRQTIIPSLGIIMLLHWGQNSID